MSSALVRPAFSYYGAKQSMGRWIAGLLPAHRVYLEPFAGSLAVLFAKAPAVHEVVNDVDDDVVTFFRVLRERPEELVAACWLTPYAREEYRRALLDRAGFDELEQARRFWVRVNQGFAKTGGARTGWSVTTARTQSTPASVRSRLERLYACAERLARVSIEHCDGAELIVRLATPDAVIYADPPYLGVTRSGRVSAVAGPADYRRDMGSEAAHRRLGEVLNQTPATVLLSGYPSALYDELYAGWWSVQLPTVAHSSNARTRTRSGRLECLWSNRPLCCQGLLFEGTQE